MIGFSPLPGLAPFSPLSSPTALRLDPLAALAPAPAPGGFDPTAGLGLASSPDLLLAQLVQLLGGLMTPSPLTDPNLLGQEMGGLDALGGMGGGEALGGGALGGSSGGSGGGGGGSVGGYSGGGGGSSYSGGGSAPVTSGGAATHGASGGSSGGTAANVPAGSQLPGSAKEAKEYLASSVPSQVDDSQFTGLQDGFSKQAAGFFKDLQKLGIKPTVTAGYETSGHSPGSDHYSGQALDFVTPGGAGDAAKVQALADKYGIDLLDEYTNPSAYSTGGHFHLSGDGTVPEGLQAANNKGSDKGGSNEPARPAQADKASGPKPEKTSDKAPTPKSAPKRSATPPKPSTPKPESEPQAA